MLPGKGTKLAVCKHTCVCKEFYKKSDQEFTAKYKWNLLPVISEKEFLEDQVGGGGSYPSQPKATASPFRWNSVSD